MLAREAPGIRGPSGRLLLLVVGDMRGGRGILDNDESDKLDDEDETRPSGELMTGRP